MTNVGCIGMPRHGKSLKLVELTDRAFKSGYEIISVMKKLEYPHIRFDPNLILTAFENDISIHQAYKIPEGKKIWMVLDEITALGGHSRMSLTQSNIMLSFLFMQAGKRRISIGWTAQKFKSVDKLDRGLTNLTIESQRIGAERNPDYFVLTYKYRDRAIPTFSKKWPASDASYYFDKYDTEEPINPKLLKKK